MQVVYPLDEVLLLAVLAGSDASTDIARFDKNELRFCAGFVLSSVEPRRMILSARTSGRRAVSMLRRRLGRCGDRGLGRG